ncbi:MAG: alpha/beta hydrolase [Nocardioides sp.]
MYAKVEQLPAGVVFLHGTGQTWATWTPLLAAAEARGVAVDDWVLLDLPGFGGSDDLPAGASLASVGRTLLAALAGHGLHEALLVGHSMGGFLTLDMLSRAATAPTMPQLTGGVVVSGAYAGIVDVVNHPLRTARARPAVAALYTVLRVGSSLPTLPSTVVDARATRALMSAVLAPVAAHPAALPDGFVRSLLTEVRPDAFRIASRTGVGYDCARAWAAIDRPLTVLFGAADRLVAAPDRRALSRACPAAVVRVLPEAGHFAHVEQPDAVLDAVVAASGG